MNVLEDERIGDEVRRLARHKPGKCPRCTRVHKIADQIDAQAARLAEVEGERDALLLAAKLSAEKQPQALAICEREGFVFSTDLTKPTHELTIAQCWEKLAFTLYSMLVEVKDNCTNAIESTTTLAATSTPQVLEVTPEAVVAKARERWPEANDVALTMIWVLDRTICNLRVKSGEWYISTLSSSSLPELLAKVEGKQ